MQSFGKVYLGLPDRPFKLHIFMKGVIYIRVSSDEQVKGTSLENQEELCRTYGVQKGIEIISVFREEGESAKDLTLNNRKEFLRALEFCRKNKPEAFIVLRVNRFARNTEDHFAVRKILLGYGTSLHSVTEPIGNSPAEKFIETVLAGAADYENGIRRQQCTDGMSQKLNQGLWPWKSPIGYTCLNFKKRGEKKTLPDPPDERIFPIIQLGLQKYAKGNSSLTDIALLMDKVGLAGIRGKKTDVKLVDKLLRCHLKFYAGFAENRWTGKEVKLLNKPMITREEYDRIVFIKTGKTRKMKHEVYNPNFPLRITILCGNCNKLVTGSVSRGNGGKYFYYHCKNRLCAEYGKAIKKDMLEKDFMENLRTITPKTKFLETFKRVVLDVWEKNSKLYEQEIGRYEKQLVILNQKRKGIFDSKEDGSYSAEEFKERKEAVDVQIATVKISMNECSIDKFDIEGTLAYANQFISDLARQWLDLAMPVIARFQKLIFPEGIPYNRKTGFGTAKLGYIYEQNRLSAGQSSLVVDPPGIEPGPDPCHGSVMPIYYGPNTTKF